MASETARPLLALAYGTPRAAGAAPARRLPGTRIDMLASERNACIVAGLPAVDRVLVYRRGRGFGRNHYFNLRRLMRPVRGEGYDLAVAIMGGFSKLLAVITYATGIPQRVGFVPVHGHPLDFGFNLAVPQPQARRALGLRPRRDGRPRLRAQQYVLFNVSSNRPEGRWTAQSIARTAAELERRHGVRTLLCGLEDDHPLMQAVGLPALATPSVHHFAALVKEARFLICSDGGPMHVAAAMRAPAFVLFASADPETWRPWGVPFGYVRSGTRVADLSVPQVLQKLEEWLPGIGRGDWI